MLKQFWNLLLFTLLLAPCFVQAESESESVSLSSMWAGLQEKIKDLPPSQHQKVINFALQPMISSEENTKEEMLGMILKAMMEKDAVISYAQSDNVLQFKIATPEAFQKAKLTLPTEHKKLKDSGSEDHAVDQLATTKTPAEPKPIVAPERQKYRLKPGDRIEISVWGEDMTRDLVVSPDGSISYILIGQLDVLDKTFSELKLMVEEKLSKYLLDPNVAIIGKSYEGNFISILGAVNSPGRKVVVSSDRLLDVMSKAGGLRYEEFGNNQGEVANLKGAYLSRKGKLVPVDFSRLLYDGDMSQNIPIELGDFIYIPSSVGSPIFITGEVNSPKALPFRGTPTLLDAITAAGGFNIKSNRNDIYVVHGGVQSSDISKLSFADIVSGKLVNPRLDPGDIIYVPPTTLTRIERISGQIIPFLNTITGARDSKDAVQTW